MRQPVLATTRLVNLSMPGRVVVITRAVEQQSKMSCLLVALGATVLELPALEIGPPDDWRPLDNALKDLGYFHWVIFSSANGVRAVQQRLKCQGKSLACRPQSVRLAAIGRKTAQQLECFGAHADFIPPHFVADSLINHFPVASCLGLNMLVPRVQSGGRTLLADVFGKAGVRVVEVPAYESRCPTTIPKATANYLKQKAVDAITFSSSKTVHHTAQLLRGHFGSSWRNLLKGTKLISIGPQTSRSCREVLGWVDLEADPHDVDGLVQACLRSMQSSG